MNSLCYRPNKVGFMNVILTKKELEMKNFSLEENHSLKDLVREDPTLEAHYAKALR